MAKTKKSAKPAKKSSLKKVAKKAKTPQKAKSKKTPAKLVTKKKTTTSKKSKSPLKKVGKVVVKSVKKAAKKVSKKVVSNKAPVKKVMSNQHLVKALKTSKSLDLSNFVTPLDNRIIVQLSGAEKMTAGGLYIPDTVSDTSGNLKGLVVAAGRGHFNKKGQLQPMDVKVGDQVLFPEYSGSKIKIQSEDLVILRESDVLGVISK